MPQPKKWEWALEIASALIQSCPENELGWIHRSFSLHELKRTAEARDNLLRVVDKAPEVATMLACYECQLGRLTEALAWLEKALETGDAGQLKLQALDDPDLEPLWRNIGSHK